MSTQNKTFPPVLYLQCMARIPIPAVALLNEHIRLPRALGTQLNPTCITVLSQGETTGRPRGTPSPPRPRSPGGPPPHAAPPPPRASGRRRRRSSPSARRSVGGPRSPPPPDGRSRPRGPPLLAQPTQHPGQWAPLRHGRVLPSRLQTTR